MTSDSSSSSSSSDDSTDRNPNPDPSSIDESLNTIEDQLTSISLSQPEIFVDASTSIKEPAAKEANGPSDEKNFEENRSDSVAELSSSGVEVVVEEVGGSSSRGGMWRNNSELEVDGSASPSSSGYAGERGTSTATSASGIEEVGRNDERNGNSFDGVMDPEAQWTPGKRHTDEVSVPVGFRYIFGTSAAQFMEHPRFLLGTPPCIPLRGRDALHLELSKKEDESSSSNA
ncbi:hypothetical protein RJ639_042700 [Escallonia herrerae]|uniref:Uncharacterized protein n=1 Tax=Escallonia herrerae TaxID=1293975 RepID=A0AA88W8R4_9ASTE|nr:hypothetical protein RJ639_042700 [Escallonia herrerae]